MTQKQNKSKQKNDKVEQVKHKSSPSVVKIKIRTTTLF